MMKYQQWIDQLGLRLPVKFRPSEQTQISSPLASMEVQEHVLEIDSSAWQSDILISLCQAALAERIDPLFSTYYFDEDTSEESCQIFIQATSPILDIWASDLAFALEPEMMRQEVTQLVEGLEIDEETVDLEMLSTIATLLAQVRRYQLDIELDVIEEMTDGYITFLASLTKEPTLGALHDAATEVCKILGLPEPELTFPETGSPVWRIPVDILESLRGK